jgi:hypothetical protein
MYIIKEFTEKTRVCFEFEEVAPRGVTNAEIEKKLDRQVCRKFSSSQCYVLSHPKLIERSDIYYSTENIYGEYVIDVTYKADVLFIQPGSIIYGAKILSSLEGLGLVCEGLVSHQSEYCDVKTSIFVPQMCSTALFGIEDLGSMYSSHRYINVCVTTVNDNIHSARLDIVANPYFFDTTTIQKSIKFEQDSSEITKMLVLTIKKIEGDRTMMKKFIEGVTVDIRGELDRINKLPESMLKASLELADVLSVFEKSYKRRYVENVLSKYHSEKLPYEEQPILTFSKFEELALDTERRLIDMLILGKGHVEVLQTPPLTYLAVELFCIIASVCPFVALKRLKYASPSSLTCIMMLQPELEETFAVPLKKENAIDVIKITETSYESLASASVENFRSSLIDGYLNYLRHVNSLPLIFKDGIGTDIQDPLYEHYMSEKLAITRELNKKFEETS